MLWGDPNKADRVFIAEGIETASAVALAFKAEIEAGAVLVAAAIATAGVTGFQVYPNTKRVTIAADRDEKRKSSCPEPTKAGERAAREFGLRHHDEGSAIEVRIALPGAPGTTTDWLDVLLSDGVEAVRAGIEAAVRFMPTKAELQDRAERAGRDAELERVAALYPLPRLDGRDLFYKRTKAGRVWVHKTIMKGKGENATARSYGKLLKKQAAFALHSPMGV